MAHKQRYLIAMDEEGFHLRKTFNVTHRLELGEVEYSTTPIESFVCMTDAVAAMALHRETCFGDETPDLRRVQ